MTAAADVFNITECSCHRCQEACKQNPGWFTPSEALSAIKAGYAGMLMRDWWEPDAALGNEERIYILSPAALLHEGCDAPEMPTGSLSNYGWNKGRCVFFLDGLCKIHSSGFKPLQCAAGNPCDQEHKGVVHNLTLARIWDTHEGINAISAWRTSLLEARG